MKAKVPVFLAAVIRPVLAPLKLRSLLLTRRLSKTNTCQTGNSRELSKK
jgi:hypothetical protein